MIDARRSEAGVVAVEFALVASLLILLLTGTLSVGVLILTQAGLQGVSAQAARCAALGSSLCPAVPQYAVTLAKQRLFAGVITASNVTVTQATSCRGATGHYTAVTITSGYWGGGLLAPVFNGVNVTVSACYPSAT